jgi:hypothetical protein
VSAAVAASAAKQGTNANAGTRVFQLPPYNVNIEHRIAVAQGAAIHDKDAELFYVIDGAATIVTGGKLVNATRNGDNMNGKSIEGGTSQALGKGRLRARAGRRAPLVQQRPGLAHADGAAPADAGIENSVCLRLSAARSAGFAVRVHSADLVRGSPFGGFRRRRRLTPP